MTIPAARPEPTSSGTNRAARRHATPHTPVPRAYVGILEAADYLGLSEKTIRRLIDRGELTAYRFCPKIVRLKISELVAVYTVKAVGE